MTLTPKGRRLLARGVRVWKKTHVAVAVESQLPNRDADSFRKDLPLVPDYPSWGAT